MIDDDDDEVSTTAQATWPADCQGSSMDEAVVAVKTPVLKPFHRGRRATLAH